MTCTKCKKETDVGYMCDLEEDIDTLFCPECFEDHPCNLGKHGEGCMTLVAESKEEL